MRSLSALPRASVPVAGTNARRSLRLWDRTGDRGVEVQCQALWCIGGNAVAGAGVTGRGRAGAAAARRRERPIASPDVSWAVLGAMAMSPDALSLREQVSES